MDGRATGQTDQLFVRLWQVHLLEPSFAVDLDQSVNFFLARLHQNLKDLKENLERHDQPNICEKLTTQDSELNGYKLVITGYSLGGAISALMTTILIGLDALPGISFRPGDDFIYVCIGRAEERRITSP